MTDVTLTESANHFRVLLPRIILGLLIFVATLAAGYRWFGMGRDFSAYAHFYGNLSATGKIFTRLEPGYAYTAWFCKFILGMNVYQYSMVLVAPSLALKFRLILKYADAPILAFIVYMLFLYPLHEYTQIRAAIGIALAFTAIDFYLEGKRTLAVILALSAVSFHYSAAALLASALFLRQVDRQPVIWVGFWLVLVGGGAVLAATRIGIYLAKLAPILQAYIQRAYIFQSPNIFSGENILLFFTLLASAVFLRPWQDRKDGFFFYLSALYLITYISLARIPVLSHRVAELFLFALFLYVFRFDSFHRSRIPTLTMVLLSGWTFFRYATDQIVSF